MVNKRGNPFDKEKENMRIKKSILTPQQKLNQICNI